MLQPNQPNRGESTRSPAADALPQGSNSITFSNFDETFLLKVIDFSSQVHVLQLMNDKLSTGFTEEEVSSSQIDF